MSLYILDTDHVTLEFEGILVTRNRHDFAQVPQLRIEDWSLPTSE